MSHARVFIALGLLVASCSTKPKDGVGPKLETYESSKKPGDVIQASREKRPKWSLDLRSWQKEFGEKGKVYFVGESLNRRTVSSATSAAQLEAMSKISDQISSNISESLMKTETSSLIAGKDVTPSELFEVVSRRVRKSSNNTIRGQKTVDTFNWARNSPNGELIDAWVLLEMREDDLQKATQAAARTALQKEQVALQKVLKDLAENNESP